MLAVDNISAIAAGLGWAEQDIVAMVWAYYDESGQYDDRGRLLNMSMGGIVAPLDRWRGFEEKWKLSLAVEGLTAFHMTDFEAWRAPFDFKLPDGARDNERHNRLLKSLLDIMLDHAEAFACFAAGNLISPDTRRAHHLALEDCVVAAVTHVVHDLWDRYGRPCNLVFGKQSHFGYGDVMKYVELYDWGEGRGRIGAVTADEPHRVLQLQAADILAFEVSKAQRDGRPERFPFRYLRDNAKTRGIPFTLKWGPFTRGRVLVPRAYP
jgi:hypothetical protein